MPIEWGGSESDIWRPTTIKIDRFGSITEYIPLMFVLASAGLGVYNFSVSTLWYYDFISMNFTILWISVALTVLVVLASLKAGDVPLPSVVAVVIFFTCVEVFSNYPLLIWRDVYLQGSVAKAIIENGRIVPTWNTYGEANPGFFFLWSAFSMATGIDLVSSNLLVLLPVSVLLATAILFLIFRKLSFGCPGAATLFAFLLANFNLNEFTFVHFNTRLFSLILILLFVFFYADQRRSQSTNVLILLTFAALVVSHLLNSLVPVFFVVFYHLLARRARASISILVLCAMIYLAWGAYVSFGTLGVQYILNSGLSPGLAALTALSPTAQTGEPFFGVVLGTYYKILLISLGVGSAYVALKLRKLEPVKLLSTYLIAVGIVFVGTFPFLASISLDRGIIFGAVALGSLPMLLLPSNRSRSLSRLRVLALILVCLLIIPQFVFVHQLPVSRYQEADTTQSILGFTYNYRGQQALFTLDDFSIYYSYYDPYFTNYHNLDPTGLQSLSNITQFFSSSPEPSLKISDYRMIIAWGTIFGHASSYRASSDEWQTEVYSPLDSHFNRVFSDGYGVIYG